MLLHGIPQHPKFGSTIRFEIVINELSRIVRISGELCCTCGSKFVYSRFYQSLTNEVKHEDLSINFAK